MPTSSLTILPGPAEDPAAAGEILRSHLARRPREVPARYFYDDRGMELFDRICELPEYPLLRAEARLLAEHAPEIARRSGATELLELGSGSAVKTGLLLQAMRARRYFELDVNEAALRHAGGEFLARFPGLEVVGYAGDYRLRLREIPPAADRLAAFLGSSIGNYRDEEARDLLRRVAGTLQPGGRFLLGVDLVKDRARLEAAYDDPAGLTAEFNRNILRVLNRSFGGNFDPARFRHRAWFNERDSWIEMRLVALRPQNVHLAQLDLTLPLDEDEELRTEISVKYDRPRVESIFGPAGFRLEAWYEDPRDRFALALGRRA